MKTIGRMAKSSALVLALVWAAPATADYTGRICIDQYIVAQTPPLPNLDGTVRPSTYLFSAMLTNPEQRTVTGPLRVTMAVTIGGRRTSSAPPYVQLPASTVFRAAPGPGRLGYTRTPVLVTVPAERGLYRIEIQVWPPSAPSPYIDRCHRRTFAFSG